MAGKTIFEVLCFFFFPMSIFSCVLFAFCFLFVTAFFNLRCLPGRNCLFGIEDGGSALDFLGCVLGLKFFPQD